MKCVEWVSVLTLTHPQKAFAGMDRAPALRCVWRGRSSGECDDHARYQMDFSDIYVYPPLLFLIGLCSKSFILSQSTCFLGSTKLVKF